MNIDNISQKTYSENEISKKIFETPTIEKTIDTEHNEDAILFDSMPEEQLELLSFQADIVDEIKAIEYNEIQESGKLASEDIIAAAVENISDLADGNADKFNIAISFIENSMQDNPNNANEVKQGIVSLIKDKIEYLD
ncbi:hypothetical protein [Arcobacter arenosus]|uniref:Uncharacterized protein n=1 Tax=Arcobacter arenosus TaxID=2576037 RepID=A0A5R8Y4X0_9BACT|nr:hypothetical protein [Arcobacter arenosus]TLP41184.1 hypothetical protein FDK22_03945 [Arcobacter arenosus]